MKMGLFGRPVGLTGGIARYTTKLLEYLPRVAPENQYLVYTNRKSELPGDGILIRRSGPSKLGRVIWEQFWLPAQLRSDGLDLYHNPDFTLPVLSAVPSIVSILDLIFMKQSEGTSWQARALYTSLTRLSAKKSRMVITISDYSAKDISQALGVPASRIRRCYMGVDSRLANLVTEKEAEEILQAFGITPPYLLYVGLITPRKGVVTLVRAFSLAARKCGLNHLVLVGIQGSGFSQISQAIEESEVRERIILAGSIDDRLLAALYKKAMASCMPSYHEGFGLPVLEAMASGAPVLSSNATSLPEVVGDAGLLAAPDDIDGWAQNIEIMATTPRLADQLREKGYIQAARFTWEQCARDHLSVYREVLNHHI